MTSMLAEPQSDIAQASTVERLVCDHLALVNHLVREVLSRVPAHVRRDDLTSAAMLALTTCAQSYDAASGVPFGSYARLRVRGALIDELRAMDWASRSVRSRARQVTNARSDLTHTLGRTPSAAEIATRMGVSRAEIDGIESASDRATTVSLDVLCGDGGGERLASESAGPEMLLLGREQIGYLRDAVSELPPRLRVIIEQYFFAQRKMSDIAQDLGVTESRVSQLRSQALATLRKVMTADDDAADPFPTKERSTAADRAFESYRSAVTTRSTLARRLAATNVFAEAHPLAFAH